MGTSAIETFGLTKSFGRRKAVENLSLRVNSGDIYGFLGPNGAGKSTTIRMLVGLVRPTSGSASILGQDVARNRTEVLKKVGGLVETPQFYKYLTARQNLRILGKLSGGCSERRIDEVLDTVGLLGRADDKVKTFSHGMCQRLGVAQALIPDPKLVILDEPTSGLDPEGMRDIRELIKHLAVTKKVTVFLSSHLLHEVQQLCNRVGIINNGRLIAEGNVENLLRREVEIFEFCVDNSQRAAEIATRFGEASSSVVGTNRLEVKMQRDYVPALNRALVSEGIEVYSIVPKTMTLEEFFLELVGRKNVDGHPGGVS